MSLVLLFFPSEFDILNFNLLLTSLGLLNKPGANVMIWKKLLSL